jgi:hypothetical protein
MNRLNQHSISFFSGVDPIAVMLYLLLVMVGFLNIFSASYQEENTTKILFGEVPGVLIQVSEDNYDYVDAQLILQDVAYFPVGTTTVSHTGVKVTRSEKNGIAGILASLLGQASEGED